MHPQDTDFLNRREKLTALWRYVAPLMLAGLALVLAWTWLQSPGLVSFGHVARQLEQGTLDRSLLETAAVILPVVVLTLFVVLGIVIVYGYAVFANERRYQRIIRHLRETATRRAED